MARSSLSQRSSAIGHLWGVQYRAPWSAVSRRLVSEMLFANLLALFMAGLMLAGCGLQQSQAERPNWSLNGPDRPAPTATAAGKKYGDWNGPGAPKPLIYEDGQ
jgi:hypothetical protein